MNKRAIYKVVTIVTVVAILCVAGYIMWHRLGLNPTYDFGAGAYYYADDPAIQDMAERASYASAVPKWIYYALFFAWGALMWFLWRWIDRRR
ncbi:MAG: hypothetical protein IKX45_04300 [Bacteroidales bacterium]|nr:hypothetical protein [Bacteroidales bacterium]